MVATDTSWLIEDCAYGTSLVVAYGCSSIGVIVFLSLAVDVALGISVADIRRFVVQEQEFESCIAVGCGSSGSDSWLWNRFS